jgi:L-lactate dehydrogenase (cytochrome)
VIVNIGDLRKAARRRLPRFLFDFVDGGAHAENTLRWNEEAFERWRFRHRVLVDVTRRTLATTVLGAEQKLPLVLAPTGFTGMLWPRGEIEAARAAEAAGIPLCLSTASIGSMEEVKAATVAPFWFQLYVTKDRGIAREFVARAEAAGCSVLALTVDIAGRVNRERDTRNGFALRNAVGLASWIDMSLHPRWSLAMLLGPRARFGNFNAIAAAGASLRSQAAFLQRNSDYSLSWKDLDWIRGLWKGKLVVKGICAAEDAARAAAAGADGLVVSNHGGRQLDGDMPAIAALPAVVEAVRRHGERVEVLLDSGIRRGHDVVKALALGAKACLIGRAFLYGLATAGRAGVAKALAILTEEIDSTLAHIGITDLRELAKRREEFLVETFPRP